MSEKIKLEYGYTKIANKLLEKFAKVKMSGQAWQVLIAILRKLYGYNKKEDWIEYSQIIILTGLSKSRVCEAVRVLRENGIVTQKRNGRKQMIGIVKEFKVKTVRVPKKRNSEKQASTVPLLRSDRSAFADLTVPLFSTTKETLTKDNKQKKTTGKARGDADLIKVFEKFQKTINPTINYGHRGNRKAAEWMIKAWGIKKVLRLVDYAIHIHGVPYAPTVTTPYQLKEKYAQVSAHFLKDQNQNLKNQIAIID